MDKINLDIQYDDDSKVSGIVYVEAMVNGYAKNFVLDTGCRTTSLMYSDFSSKLPKVGENESSGTVGTHVFDLVEVEQIEFGPIKKISISLSRSNDPKIDRNLLGMDVLKESSIFLSYRKSILDFKTNSSVKKFEPIHPDSRGHQPYINIKFQDQVLKALWDTGAGITIVDINFIRRNAEMFELVGESVGTDSTGNKIVTPNYKIKSLNINGHHFDSHDIAAMDMSHINSKSGNPVYITLGFSTIRQADWFFDFKNNKWAVIEFYGARY